jgi:regulator of sigma E protease
MSPILSFIMPLATKAYGIALGFLGISFLVGIHELGHFFCCKLFGVHTPSFSLGFGPRIYTKKIGDTEFSLSALPLGGYVEISGMEEVGQGEQEYAKDQSSSSFSSKPYYQKMIIILGGIAVNLAFSWIALTLLFALKGIPAHQAFISEVATNQIESIVPDSPAEKAGLKVGQRIISINNERGIRGSALVEYLRSRAGQTITIALQETDLASSPTTIQVNLSADSTKPPLGVKFALRASPPMPLVNASAMSANTIYGWITSTFRSLANMVSTKTTSGLGGPIAVIHSITKSADSGFIFFLVVLCFISVGIACLNLVPLPIFDGGQALFYSIEALTGRSFNNLRLWIHYISWLAVVGLIILLTWRDLWRILVG